MWALIAFGKSDAYTIKKALHYPNDFLCSDMKSRSSAHHGGGYVALKYAQQRLSANI
jgi:hypothetical protein